MTKNLMFGILFVLGLLFSGCGVKILPSTDKLIGQERVLNKNYIVGQRQTAFIGQPMVKVKNFRVNRYKPKYYRASDDFEVEGLLGSGFGSKDKDYKVHGVAEIDGKKYTILEFFQRSLYQGLLMNDDGTILNKIVDLSRHERGTFSRTIHPENLKFTGKEEIRIDLNYKYQNFEIIYGGIDDNSFQASYREFGPIHPLPVSFQNLHYDISQNKIRFGEIVIEIHIVTNERIEYTVVSDGLENIKNET